MLFNFPSSSSTVGQRVPYKFLQITSDKHSSLLRPTVSDTKKVLWECHKVLKMQNDNCWVKLFDAEFVAKAFVLKMPPNMW